MSNKDTDTEVEKSRETNSRSDEETEQSAQQTQNKPDRKKKSLSKKRDTHFLCFPLVTSTSIAQLAKSLRHFRDVSTTVSLPVSLSSTSTSIDQPVIEINNSGNQVPSESQTQQHANDVIVENGDEDENKNTTPIQQPYLNPTLQIIPPPAHRPPGTFHLTLGVMDLSTQQAMDRATKILREIDYRRIVTDLLRNQRQGREEEDGQRSGASSQSQIATRGFTIDLLGLGTFPDAGRARVLYARPRDVTAVTTSNPLPSSSSRPLATKADNPTSNQPRNETNTNANDDNTSIQIPLHDFALQIRQIFRKAGLITETRPLVLHATVANMRYAVQSSTASFPSSTNHASQTAGGGGGGGKKHTKRKPKWQRMKEDGNVNATELVRLFEEERGSVGVLSGGGKDGKMGSRERAREEDDENENEDEKEEEKGTYIWAKQIPIDKLAICKLGAVKSDDPVLGLVYPPVFEVDFFPSSSD